MRILVIHPGQSQSTADVEAGLVFGLQHHGCQVWRYRLDMMVEPARRWLFSTWRVLKNANPGAARPTDEDVFYQAGIDSLQMALRRQVDAVIVVSAMLFHPEVMVLLRRAGIKVFLLFTETPYDLDAELKLAALADGCWTNERTCVEYFRRVQPNSGYLPHGWHPERHRPGPQPGDADIHGHDVVFVGTGFPERIAWFEGIDWSGIDLGLYGNWDKVAGDSPLRYFMRGDLEANRFVAALYRRAKVGLNLYRDLPIGVSTAESLNPRAYELAACGACFVSPDRAEGREVFGSLVPAATEGAIRALLGDAERREAIRRALPATVAGASWVERAKVILGDLQFQRAA